MIEHGTCWLTGHVMERQDATGLVRVIRGGRCFFVLLSLATAARDMLIPPQLGKGARARDWLSSFSSLCNDGLGIHSLGR